MHIWVVLVAVSKKCSQEQRLKRAVASLMLKRAHPFSIFLPPPLRALQVAISNTGPSYVRVLATLREESFADGTFPYLPLGGGTFEHRRASINKKLSMGRRGITLTFGMCAGGAVKPHRQRVYPARPLDTI